MEPGRADADEAVRLRPRATRPVVRALLLSVPWVVLLVLDVVGSGVEHRWLIGLVLLVMLPSPVLRWLTAVSLVRRPWAVEIGPTGVAWYGSARPLPWSQVERVEVHLGHGLRRLLLLGDRVLFVTAVEASFADRAGVAPASRGVWLASVHSSAGEVVDAIRRFSEVRVYGWGDDSFASRAGSTNA